MKMKLHFLGAAHEVTGSCTLVEVSGHRILVDCGMEQGADLYENGDLPLSPGEVEAVLLTHAHIDHAGKLPLLVKNGFGGTIYTTGATASLCKIMLLDSAHIQEFEAEWRNRKAKRGGGEIYEPLYTADDALQTVAQMHPCEYGTDIPLFEGVSIRFTDAGHLLGSASILITAQEDGNRETVLFSGDVGNVDRPLIRDPQTPPAADAVVIESTYGDRLHGERPDYIGHLSRVLQRTFDRGGNVVIPCFAVGRTQELLYLLRQIKAEGLVPGHPHFPVWVDSPLAVEATGIYAEGLDSFYDEETLSLRAQGIDPIRMPDLQLAVTADESRRINADKTPKVILSASGMCEAGRIRHHLKHNLWRQESTVLFVGYQSEGTLGRKIIEGAPAVKLFGEEVRVAAQIETLEGISGHADRQMLTDWLRSLPDTPHQVFVNHGNDTVCDSFAAHLREELGVDAVAPYNGSVYDLSRNICLDPGNRERISRAANPSAARAAGVFRRLQEAGSRLLRVIEKNRGISNKEMAKLTDQINSLCDRWE